MRRLVPALAFAVALSLALSGCALRSSRIELDKLKATAMSSDLDELDRQQVTARMQGLFGALTEGKVTSYLTGSKIRDFFKDQEQLNMFIAITADLFREAGLKKDRIEKFELGDVVVEPNGVIAHAEVTYWGHFYFIWSAKVRQAVTWTKEEGTWYVTMAKRPAID